MLVLIEGRSPCGEANPPRVCEPIEWIRYGLSRKAGGSYRGRYLAEGEIGMKEKTFQQKFGVFALVAAVLLLIVNLTVAEATVLGISSPLLLGVTGTIMMRDDRSESSSGAKED